MFFIWFLMFFLLLLILCSVRCRLKHRISVICMRMLYVVTIVGNVIVLYASGSIGGVSTQTHI